MSKKKKERKERQLASARKRAAEHKTESFLTTYRRPDGMDRYEIEKAGKRKLIIVPFTAGKGNPFADPGQLYYERTFFIHQNVGPEDSRVVCLAKTFKEKCPICEERMKLMKKSNADADAIKALQPKERQLFYVIDITDDEDNREVQILEISHHFFGKALDTCISGADPEEETLFDRFYAAEDGGVLKTLWEKGKFNGRAFYKCENIQILPRKFDLDEDVWAELPSLDSLLVKMSYDEMKKLFLQVDDEDEDEDDSDDDDTPKKKKSSKSRDEDDDDDDDDEEEESPKKSKSKKDDDDDDDDEDDEEDDDEDDDDEEDEDDDDDDDDDDDEEEEPKKKNKDKNKVRPVDEMGIEKGSMVKHPEHGKCRVLFVNPAGTEITIEDEDGTKYGHIDPYDVTLVKGKSKKDEDDDDEDEDDEPKKKKSKKKKGGANDEDDLDV